MTSDPVATTRVLDAEVSFSEHPFDRPLVLSSGAITHLTQATATVRVSVAGRVATGQGAVSLSDLWAWPGSGPRQPRLAAMVARCRDLAGSLVDRVGGEPAHPLELGTRLHHSLAADRAPAMPVLADAVCASAFDSAIHDAAGAALARSAFSFYDSDVAIPSLDAQFAGSTTSAVRATLRPPVEAVPGWWVVSPGDDLVEAASRVAPTGISRFKLKTTGADPAADAARVAEVSAWATTLVPEPIISVDPNEGARSPDDVAAFLSCLESTAPQARAAIAYLEQPTPRSTLATVDWSGISAQVPLVVDEGWTTLDDLDLAAARGWTGVAIKTCKGHSAALAAAAWAHRHHLPITVQDLTLLGRAAVHSYLVAAHLPTTNGIELNSPQYLPGANADWLPRYDTLFTVRGGYHRLAIDGIIGLGGQL